VAYNTSYYGVGAVNQLFPPIYDPVTGGMVEFASGIAPQSGTPSAMGYNPYNIDIQKQAEAAVGAWGSPQAGIAQAGSTAGVQGGSTSSATGGSSAVPASANTTASNADATGGVCKGWLSTPLACISQTINTLGFVLLAVVVIAVGLWMLKGRL